MKKILSFFAFAAMVFSFAACGGGNAPEVKDFEFKVETLSDRMRIMVTPLEEGTYCWGYFNTANNNLEYVIEFCKTTKCSELRRLGRLTDEPVDEKADITDDLSFVIYAFRIEEKEDGYAKIIGSINTYAFKTMPDNTLGGEFSVSATRKVHFARGNMKKEEQGAAFTFCFDQWERYATNTWEYPQDNFRWNDAIDKIPSPFFILSADEWWYLFRKRPNAENLFQHATVNGVKGIVLFPDNWDKTVGKTDAELEFVWEEGNARYVNNNPNFNGYEKNTYDLEKWAELELSGAVFLPQNINSIGQYWSSTANSTLEMLIHGLWFEKDRILLSYLKPELGGLTKNEYYLFRPVREVK